MIRFERIQKIGSIKNKMVYAKYHPIKQKIAFLNYPN
jgi:hypothetical protein